MTTAKREAALSFLSTISLGPDTPLDAIHSSGHSPKPPDSTYDDNDSSITVTSPTPDRLARPPRPRRKSTMRHDTAATSFLANISLNSSSSTAATATPQPSVQNMERRQSGQTPSKHVTARGQKAPLSMSSTHSDDSESENGEINVLRQRSMLVNDRTLREENVTLQEFDRTCEDEGSIEGTHLGVGGGSRANTLRKPKRSATADSTTSTITSHSQNLHSPTLSSVSLSFPSSPSHQSSARNNLAIGTNRASYQMTLSPFTVDSSKPPHRRSSSAQDNGVGGSGGGSRQPRRIVYTRGSSPQVLSEALRRRSVVFTTEGGSPLGVFSMLKYYDEKIRQQQEKRRMARFNREYIQKQLANIDSLKRKRPESFGHLLLPFNTLGSSAEIEDDSHHPQSAYDPYYLDDPELKTGKHRTVISLPCFMGSIIQYARPADLKLELNDHFRQTHPEIDPTITLSKIRSVKTRLLAVGQELDLEISSVAKSFAYFEKLVLKNLVTKKNRKLIAACCLFLATKVNEPKDRQKFGQFLDATEKQFGVTSKEVREYEFSVFASLEFNLYIPRREFMPHFERIIVLRDFNNVQEYLGENPFFMEKES